MLTTRTIILLLGLATYSMSASADLFIYQAPDGSRMLTDHLLDDPAYHLIRGGQAEKGAGSILAGRKPAQVRHNPKAYDSLIARMAKAHEVPYSLIKAVIFVESRFNPNATSRKGAAGLMQLMPETADEYGVDNVYDPAQNIEAGVLHLKYLLKRYRNKRLAIAAYNAGQTNVDRYRGIPPYTETRTYVRRVLRYNKIYRSQLKQNS